MLLMTNLQMCNRVSFLSMYETGKIYGIFNEEYWCVVTDQVPNTLLGVKFNCETTRISENETK